jgi:hypothetical protein
MQFSWSERLGVAAAFLSAALAGIGAYVVAERLPWHLGGLAAVYGFLATAALGLRAVDGIRDDRIRRYIEHLEKYKRDE